MGTSNLRSVAVFEASRFERVFSAFERFLKEHPNGLRVNRPDGLSWNGGVSFGLHPLLPCRR